VREGNGVAKAVARSLCPPVLWNLGRSVKTHLQPTPPSAPHRTFHGPYASWQEAVARSDGWDADVITARSLEAALKVRDGEIEWEQDTIPSRKIQYSPAILAMLAIAVQRRRDDLCVIDFGGNLATNYYQNRKILAQLAPTRVRWSIVERPVFAALGNEHFARDGLAFHSSLRDALRAAGRTPDAILFSGSLQCLADPLATLDEVVASGVGVLAFDRLIVSPADEHRVYVQSPDPDYYYPATYPTWCFGKQRFVDHLEANGYRLVEDFTLTPEREFDHCGMVFVRAGGAT